MRSLPLILVLALAGCAPSVGTTRFDPTPRAPLGEAEVRFTDVRPDGCTSIARLRVETGSDGRMQRALARKAASLGADTVVLEDEDPALSMLIVAGVVGVPVNATRFTATALSCP